MNLKQKILLEHLLRIQIDEALTGNKDFCFSLQGHYSGPKIAVSIIGSIKVSLMFNVDEEISLDENYLPDGSIDIDEARRLIIEYLAKT